MSVRVLLVDDQDLVRLGFRLVIESQADLEVVGEAGNGRQALDAVAELQPDVVLMDIRMPEMDGVEATRRLLETDSDARIIVLTTFDLDEYVYAALRAGASGFLLKDAQPAELLVAIRAVAAGDAVIAPSVTRRLLGTFARRLPLPDASPASADPLAGQLTAREQEVLQLVAGGLANAEIAAELVVSETTVKSHVGRILAKLELRDRVQIVIYAYEHDLIARTSE